MTTQSNNPEAEPRHHPEWKTGFQPDTYGEFLNGIRSLSVPNMEVEEDEVDGRVYETSTEFYDDKITGLRLPERSAAGLGLTGKLDCRIIGSVEPYSGLSLYMRRSFPPASYRPTHGFYVKPVYGKTDTVFTNLRTLPLGVVDARAQWPPKPKTAAHWGHEYFTGAATLTPPEMVEDLWLALSGLIGPALVRRGR